MTPDLLEDRRLTNDADSVTPWSEKNLPAQDGDARADEAVQTQGAGEGERAAKEEHAAAREAALRALGYNLAEVAAFWAHSKLAHHG